MSVLTRREFGLGVAGAMAFAPASRAQAEDAPAGSLTDVPGIRVGHFTDTRRPTGCTAILFDQPAAAGVDYDGSAPGESQEVMLQPSSPVERIHGLFLSGGGIMGLPAAGGVLRFLEERKVGFDWGNPGLRIPIIVSAVIDDLSVGDPKIRPDADAAYQACANATSTAIAEGNVGAGTGGTVAKMHRGRGYGGMKGGLGTASLKLGDVIMGALAVVNAAGDIRDWRTGRLIAGPLAADRRVTDSVELMRASLTARSAGALEDPALHSTTLAVVATNVDLTKTSLTKLAMMANCGASRAIRPYHTTGDGDQLFAVSTGSLQRPDVPLTTLGALAADLIADAIVRGVQAAKSVEGWVAVRDL